jgi:hypothetical protein
MKLMNLRPSDVAYWRAASVDAIFSAASAHYSVQGSKILDGIREKLLKVQNKPDDAELMAMLKQRAPDAEQITNYPR